MKMMPQIMLQTPIPTSNSELLAGVAVLFWFIAVMLLGRSFRKIWRHFGDIFSFLVYVLGLIVLEILIF